MLRTLNFFEDFFFPPCFPSSKLTKAVTQEKIARLLPDTLTSED